MAFSSHREMASEKKIGCAAILPYFFITERNSSPLHPQLLLIEQKCSARTGKAPAGEGVAPRGGSCQKNPAAPPFPFLNLCRVLGVACCGHAVQMASTTWSPCAPLWANQNECSILTLDVVNATMPLEHSNKGVMRLPWAQIEVEKDGSGCESQC